MKQIIYISVLLCAYTVYASDQEYLKGGLLTEESILETTLPKSSLLERTAGLEHEDLLKILNELVELNELKPKVEKAALYSPNQHLQGLSILLAEVITEGCTWINGVVDGGLSCDASGLTELRNKLTAHKVMQLSTQSMDAFLKANSTCA